MNQNQVELMLILLARQVRLLETLLYVTVPASETATAAADEAARFRREIEEKYRGVMSYTVGIHGVMRELAR